jgi:hypothetical protein
MTNCSSKNPLQRDGTSQQQRTLKALLPGYIPVDERGLDDLKTFAIKYAEEIQYFDQNNIEDGNWLDFFDKNANSTEYNTPHYALFITFLKLFKYAQDEMNKITKKHLDFFYRDVLQLKENDAVPDQVFLIFELAKHVKAKKHLLKKSTKLKAGKDSEGNNLTYKLVSDMTLNIASVSEMKAVFSNVNDIHTKLQKYPKDDHRIYASTVANSIDGKGAALGADKSWRTFGTVKFPNIKKPGDTQFTADRDQADIGFAIASPNLFLAEGERIVTIELYFSSDTTFIENISDSELFDAFEVMFSSEEGWIQPLWEQSTYIVDGVVDQIVEHRILDFLNAVTTPEEIAGTEPQEGPVYDDPTAGRGYGDQLKDYDIGLSVAAEIIRVRDEDHGGQFEEISQIRAVKYVGQDKINDLAYTFSYPHNSTKADRVGNKIIIKRTITKAQEAIVAYDKEKLLDPFDTKWPVAKILLNKKYLHNPYIYSNLKDLTLKHIDLRVDVREVRDIIVQNDQSVLDPGKPFQPFTNRPQLGANYYIGSWEAFQKSLSSVNIDLKWHGLPSDTKGFGDYYKNYVVGNGARNNTSFQANIALLDKKVWKNLTPTSIKLFDNVDDEVLKADNFIKITNTAGDTIGDVKRDHELKKLKKYDQKSQKGFIKLILKGADFGHKHYHVSYTSAVLTSLATDVAPPVDDYSGDLPNEPYTPELEEVWLDYVAKERIMMIKVDEDDYKNRIEQYFHVHPFGVGEIDRQEDKNNLLPQYLEEGALYIGVKDINPPENLSLLIQILEGSSDPDLLPPSVTWSYLTKNVWKKFPDANILSDSTKGLITTGVVKFDIPTTATKNNSILTNGIYWLRAAVQDRAHGIPHLVDIKAQAVAAVFEDDNNAPNHLSTPLQPGTIGKLLKSDSSVKKIEQPYTSFDGKVKEESSAFYTRVSERLRHKQRAITIWDYERLVLQQFTSIYKVKCLNHTRFTGTLETISEAAPCHVSMIIISNVRNKNAVNPLKPRTSLVLLNQIQEFLTAIKPPYIQLHINNPVFEEIKTEFKVRFHRGYDKGLYETILINAIKQYLSPWAYESGSDLVFGSKIHKSMVLNFVEQQEYVDYITCFSMFHIVPGDANNDPTKDVDEAIASSSASVLGSADTHVVHILESEDCECADNEVITTEIASADECPCN